MEYLGNLRNTVANAFNAATATPQPPALSRNDVLGLEENERTRRMAQVSQSNVDKQNAANISGLIKKQSFPVFRGNVSRGYKRVTTRFEEEERRRRLTNKSESALRRANGNKTSRMVQELGWPFYQQNHNGPEYLVMDPTKILEEEEREWRTSKQYWGPTAKHNAAMVANILRWSNFQRNPRAGFARHVKFIEEKERKERMQNMERDMQNAYNEAGLIKQKGAPFYVQEPLSSKRDYSEINRIEELERKRRMGNREEEQLAHELAGLVKNDLPHTSSKSLHRDASKSMDVGSEELEEQERGRRMLDVRQQNIAKQNAKNVSLMVRESSSNKLTGTGPMWFSISRNSMRALEEIERTRRLRDIEGQRDLRQGAKLVSDMISGRLAAPAKPSIHAIEEEERNSRLHDRQQQQIAIKTARKVSGLIARHNLMSNNSKSFTLAEEESERTRRLQDQNQQMLARNNAKKVASLVSSLNVAPGNKHALPTESLPTYSAPVTASPIAINMPLQKELPRIPTSAPISAAPISAAPISAAPISAAPISAAPIASAPLAKSVAPIASAPISAPIVSAPIVSAPLAKSVAPISAAPIASAPISAPILSAPLAKSVAPISAAPVSAAPVFSAPVSAAPITSAPRSAAPLASVVSPAPLSSAPLAKPTAPIFTAPVSSAPIATSPLVQSAPVSAAPIARSAPISAAPITRSAPTSSNVQPIVLSSTSAPVPVAPLATATSVPITRSTSFNTSVPSTTSVPISAAPVRASSFNTAPTVPIDTAAIAHASLGDRERKRLLKQADRHNKHSERSVRKAEKSMLKAEKMHQKGRDDKALKLESKAEQFMKTAEHERRWASGIQGELAPNAPAPASM